MHTSNELHVLVALLLRRVKIIISMNACDVKRAREHRLNDEEKKIVCIMKGIALWRLSNFIHIHSTYPPLLILFVRSSCEISSGLEIEAYSRDRNIR